MLCPQAERIRANEGLNTKVNRTIREKADIIDFEDARLCRTAYSSRATIMN